MSRNCPQCGRNLSKVDVYFCSSCGAVLGNSVGKTDRRYLQVSGEQKKPSTGSIFSVWGLLAGAGVFLLLVASVTLSTHLTNKAVSNGKTMLEIVFPKAVGSPDNLGLPSGTVTAEKEVVAAGKNIETAGFLPFDTNFSVVFYSSSDFTDALNFFGIVNSFDQDFLKTANHPPFLIVVDPAEELEGEDGISILFFPKEKTQAGTYKKYVSGGFSEIISDELVIITNNIEMGNKISEVSGGLKKGLNLNSSYVNIKNKIPETVRSKIFVFTDIGVGYVNKFDTGAMPESLKALVLSYMKSGSYYGFIEYE
ncbi:hypothetical protein A2380_03425 [candidate division WWE3 bacterium RIFOXYB1_FULL_43_24]|uniref:Uncharacterized protein n=2 Tax=Katanobacteria TaxID=422282 RepID=A0A0G0YKB9_UNCKA|nr:MAG: hypothetical protein UU92_C0012G0016 [candidate division WWE3 bacterium GW2011_GWA1_42_12]KKS34023.1 MAG: hypothetical protein UU97_C0016G0016 [candidate division WWE3 bacterium GW2011_GWD1_42_14]KKS37212.1 MAG: hypothetical protein UV00_C0016G0016 [candidate division WWE3 bacterium GW2011_GWF1_42_14]KKS40073.1 MAG: hypothetical protein UV03_C0013G0016 [candidate division WWE3 bacterium GW2011_GWE1_42_16]KKS66757.1 MAG: hypothetical protein UV35_C0008G0016 [candidate division WWE3 bacte